MVPGSVFSRGYQTVQEPGRLNAIVCAVATHTPDPDGDVPVGENAAQLALLLHEEAPDIAFLQQLTGLPDGFLRSDRDGGPCAKTAAMTWNTSTAYRSSTSHIVTSKLRAMPAAASTWRWAAPHRGGEAHDGLLDLNGRSSAEDRKGCRAHSSTKEEPDASL